MVKEHLGNMISIIMPAYNAENTIDRSINSIVKQTYQNWELIIVNDGSTDRTSAIINEWMIKDSRIKGFTIENSGPSNARTIAINNSNGNFVAFCDADDEMEEVMLEKMIAEIDDQVDMVVCSFSGRTNSDIADYKGVLSKQEAISRVISSKEFGGYLWNKLFKKSIIKDNNLSFDENIYCCEDLLFVIEYLVNSNEAVFIPEKLYNYADTPESLTNVKFSWKKISSVIAREKVSEILHSSDDKKNSILSDSIMLPQAVFAYRQIMKHMTNDVIGDEDKENYIKYTRVIKKICRKYGLKNILHVKSTLKVKFDIIRIGFSY